MSPLDSDKTSHTPQMKLLFKLLSMEVYLPIDFSEFGIGSHSTCPLCELLWYSLGPCGSGSGEEILLFGELAAMEAFIPNEMGLPILAEMMNPTVLYSNTTVSGTSCREPLTGHFNLTTDTKFVSKTTSVLRVLVPWLNSSLAVGVDTEKTLSLPLKVNGKFEKIYKTEQERTTGSFEQRTGGAVNSDSYNGQFTGRKLRPGPAGIPVSPGTKMALTMALQTTRDDLVPMVVTLAVPFSCIKPLRPGTDPATLERLLVLRNSNSGPVEQTIKLGHKITGIDASLRYEGDQPSPYSLSSLIDHIRTPAKFVSMFGARSGKYECSMLSLVPFRGRNDATVITVFIDTHTIDLPAGDAFCRSEEHGVAECSPSTTVGVETTFPSGLVLAGNLTHHLLPQEDPYYASSATSLSLSSSLYHAGNQLVRVVGNTTHPVDLSLPELADWLHVGRSLNASFELNVWAGASSLDMPRVLRLKAAAGVTPERCRLLKEKVKTVCSADLLEPALALDGLAVYDVLNVTTEHQNEVHPGLTVPWRALQDYLFASLYPAVLPVYGECGCSPTKGATMIANRSLLTNDWSASCPSCCRPWTAADLKLPRCFDTYILALARFTNFSSDPAIDYHVPETVRVVVDESLYPVVDTLNVPQPVDSSLSFDYSNYGVSPHASSNDAYYDDVSHRVDNVYNNYDYNSDDSSSVLDAEQGTCWTSNDKLRTADGLYLTKIPSSCYQLAVAHCYFEPEWYVFTHVDVNAGADARSPFFRYLDADFDVDVYLGFNTLIINGKRQGPVVDRITITHPLTQQEIGWCSASTAEGRTSCTVTGVVHMEANRQGGSVKLLGEDRVCGMCGDNNGAIHDDNVGAHLCRYRDLSLMAASWTVRNSSLPSHELSSSNPNQEKTSDDLDQVSNIFDGCCTRDPELLDAIRRVEEIENSSECDHPDMDNDSFVRLFKDLPTRTGNPLQEDTVSDQPGPQQIEVLHQPAADPDEVSGLHLQASNSVNDVSEPTCMFSAYRIITEPGNEFPVLLSLEATHFCRKEYNCYPVMPEKTLVRLYGWHWKEAPKIVLLRISKGYLLELPEDLTAEHSELRIIKHPSSCEASWTKDFECPWVPELDEQLNEVHEFQNSDQCIRIYMPRPWRLPDLSGLPDLPRLPVMQRRPSFPSGPDLPNGFLEPETWELNGLPTPKPQQKRGAELNHESDFISESELEPEIVAEAEIFIAPELEPGFVFDYEPQPEIGAEPEHASDLGR
ncbi:von Willebrand factor type D domain [Trinorchestia longiramus]|nr:von Willebrand factor type D domain [Trinorchestia longiramus]